MTWKKWKTTWPPNKNSLVQNKKRKRKVMLESKLCTILPDLLIIEYFSFIHNKYDPFTASFDICFNLIFYHSKGSTEFSFARNFRPESAHWFSSIHHKLLIWWLNIKDSWYYKFSSEKNRARTIQLDLQFLKTKNNRATSSQNSY